MLQGCASTMPHPHLPQPSRERWPAAAALLALIAGVLVIAFAITDHSDGTPALPPAAVPPQQVTAPSPSAAEAAKVVRAENPRATGNGSGRGARSAARSRARAATRSAFSTPLPDNWVESFYPIYAEAQRVYGVNWLLIASIHRQETAFSTHPTTYRGLNFAGCCGGPMQFNVTNGDSRGRGSTWDRYRHSYKSGNRPERYLSRRRSHPSLYDDFDTVMAAAHLLRDNGAGAALDASAWRGAYDYYGHDLTGVDYASRVVARAIGWARDGFCAACADDAGLFARVDAAWGEPVRAELVAAEEAHARREAALHKARKQSARARKRAR